MDPVPALQRLLADIRRRRLFRAAAVYLAGAFVVLQLGDLLVQPLGLPDRTLTLLVLILAAGFVLTLVLAWLYDVTPDGVRRTPAARERGAEPGEATGTPRGVGPRAHDRADRGAGVPRPARALAVAGLVVLLLAGGWLARAARSGPGEAPAPDGAVAVLPFRVSGATAELGYMREGMVDLVTAVLTERAGLPAVSPRLLARELGDDGGDATRAAGAVRRLGGARLITGEVVGRPDRLTISATLVDLARGDTVRASVSGTEDELERLVDRLAGRLLLGGLHDGVGRAGSLADVPVAALRAYLEGVALQRASRFAESLDRFRLAMDVDSTFALAALAFEISTGWSTAPEAEQMRIQALAWRHRDRLGPLDRKQLEGMLGPDFPEISSPAVRLRITEEALTALPDRPELWILYGDILFHEGQAIGAHDWQRRAIAAFERARTLAPDHPEAEIHLLDLGLMVGDSVMLRDVAARLLRRDSSSDLRRFVHGALALHEDRPEAWQNWRDSFRTGGSLSLHDIAWRALYLARATEPVLETARALEAAAVTAAEAAAPLSAQIQLLANTGRPAEATRAAERRLRQEGPAWRNEHLQLLAWIGFAWDGDTTSARTALEELRAAVDAAQAGADAGPHLPFYICTVAVLDLLQGRSDWAAGALPRLEHAAPTFDDPDSRMQARSCPLLIRAGLAHAGGDPAEARQRLRELEDYLTQRPFGAKRLRTVANFLAATLHQQHGDLDAALAALRRLQDTALPNLLSTALREEGLVLERLGRADEAADVYRRYLALREHAEPGLLARDEAIRRRLATLEGGAG
jgi:tetratricopeptide (TPR) repeat protein